jgi:hypothetical protein
MSGPASHKGPTSSSSPSAETLQISNDMRIPAVKLDNIEILTGHENYQDWADQVTIVLDAISCSSARLSSMEKTL